MKSESDIAVAISDLMFRWDANGGDVFKQLNLEVSVGERLFVQGFSGSGKSTLLGLLAGVTTADSGSISVLGSDLGALDASARDRFRADHIGYIFQQFNLIPYLSVRENVMLGCQFSDVRRGRVGDVASGANALLDRLGMTGLGDRSVESLSVGQQQRVAAARAFIGEPELILADEPTSALDAVARDQFLDLLFDVCGDSTLIVVSHDVSIGSRFQRTLSLGESE